MPNYTYRCQSCDVEFKKTQTFFAKPLKRCPQCRTGAVRRVPQVPAIIFQGSGWYSTDHRSATGPTRMPNQKDGQADHSKTQRARVET